MPSYFTERAQSFTCRLQESSYSRGIKVSVILPLGTMSVLKNSWQPFLVIVEIFQPELKWWTDQHCFLESYAAKVAQKKLSFPPQKNYATL